MNFSSVDFFVLLILLCLPEPTHTIGWAIWAEAQEFLGKLNTTRDSVNYCLPVDAE
jgi:hypothetical protein